MVAIYVRQSIEKKDSISLENQIEFAKRELFHEDFKIYQDSGFSGKNTNRPAFVTMMNDIDDGVITKVVVYRLDRVSRSLVDFADFINVLEDKGIAFVSATEKFDTSTPVGRAMLYIVVVFAQLERETIAERVKDNYYARVKKGAWGGGPAAYGFNLVRTTIDGKKATKYEANQDLAHVQRIFELYYENHASLAYVQKVLIAEKIISAKGVNFTNTKLSSILKNPAYVKADIGVYNFYKSRGVIMANEPEEFHGKNGCILVGKRDGNERKYMNVADHLLALGSHEGAIDSRVFLACQEKLAKNRQIKNTFKGKYSWLTGLVKCGHCGYSFSVRFGSTKDGRTPYFGCSGRYLYKICDTKQTHKVHDVEAFVEKRLIEESKDYTIIGEKKEDIALKSYHQKVFEVQEKINHLLMSLESASGATIDYINHRINELHVEKQSQMDDYAQSLTKHRPRNIPSLTTDDWIGLNLDRKSKLARDLIDKVLLSQNNIEVVFK